MEVQILLPLRASLSSACGDRRANVDAVLQCFEVRVGQVRDCASSELGFEHRRATDPKVLYVHYVHCVGIEQHVVFA